MFIRLCNFEMRLNILSLKNESHKQPCIVLKSFPRQSQSMQFHEVQSGLSWYFPFLSNSTESMSQWVLGFPDLNICFMWRSLLQGFLEVQELEFWTCLCHHQRSTFLLKQVISEFILVFDICRGDSSWIPFSQCEEWETGCHTLNRHLSKSAMHMLIKSR